jgi:8-hydroxy-5-deazaflavin:NADPH oxidoreductase
MRFAIIGSGNVGTSIARAVLGAGHEATVADVNEDGLQAIAAALPVQTTTSNTEAIADADAVVLAVPFGIVQDLATTLSSELAGKIVIDVTNPLAADLSGLSTNGRSAAELVQDAAPQARVVKAFNTVFAANQSVAEVDGTQLDGFVASNDEDAKATVIGLLDAVGFRPIDVGALSAARYLEGMAFLNIALNARNGWAWRSGWKLVGPTAA